jgi:glycerol-3-phosphate dehydrogenase
LQKLGLFFLTLLSLMLPCAPATAGCDSTYGAVARVLESLDALDRDHALAEMQREPVDLLILGGGATGLSAANSAANRGLRVGVVEKNDLASGTSGYSTKINHGGVRYLKDAIFDFLKLKFRSGLQRYRLVHEGLHERNLSLQNAPHNVKPLEIFTPVYSYKDLVQMWIGLKLYEKMAGASPFPKSRYVSAKQALELFPNLKAEGLRGGVMYSDGQFNDTQMAVDLAQTAARQGGLVANYTEVVRFIKDETGKDIGVVVQDKMTGKEHEIRAKVILNAGGPFSDSIRKLSDPDAEPLLKTSSGIHIVLPKKFLEGSSGILLPETSDGRVLFILPWQEHVLVGTTDHKEAPSDNAKATASEIDEVFHELRKIFADPPSPSDVSSDWKGFRPLLAGKGDTKSAVRDFVIVEDKSGLLTIVGGKWTNARYMGDRAVDRAAQTGKLTPPKESTTEGLKITGAQNYSPEIIPGLVEKYAMTQDIATHLGHAYGDRAEAVAELAKLGFGKRLHPDLPNIEAEVIFAVEIQAAQTPVDVLARRTRMSFLNKPAAIAALPRVVEIMGDLKEWSPERRAEETQKALAYFR